MKDVTNNHSPVRAAVYHALAEAMTDPTPVLFSKSLEAATAAAVALRSRACNRAARAMNGMSHPTLRSMESEYAETMSPPHRRPPALYESLHRHGHLMGSAAREVERWYARLGLQPAGGELPDHAGIELSFLAALIACEGDLRSQGEERLAARLQRERARFLRRHAAFWLPNLGNRLAASESAFYATIGCWLDEFLREEISRVEPIPTQRPAKPRATRSSACTLCAACIARCPTTALAIVENDQETRLVLRAQQCIGCARCSAICPVNCLEMVATAADGPTRLDHSAAPRTLVRSRRMYCPECGQATVSRAEWNQVVAMLNADADMQRRLSLCVDCKNIVLECQTHGLA